MHTLTFIVNVIFAVYILNFISGFLNSFMSDWSRRARGWTDLLLGVALLIAVILLNS